MDEFAFGRLGTSLKLRGGRGRGGGVIRVGVTVAAPLHAVEACWSSLVAFNMAFSRRGRRESAQATKVHTEAQSDDKGDEESDGGACSNGAFGTTYLPARRYSV